MGPAGGTITVRLANGTLTVDDQGPGIEPADLPHVFERFYRSTESRSMPGSGLGLAIVQQVVGRHSGTVTAGAAPGGGTRMTMWIPGHASPTSGPRPPVHQPLVPQGRVSLPSPTPGGWRTATTPDIVWRSSRRRRPPQTAPSALALPAGKDGRVRLLALALAAAVLTGCSGGSSSPAARPGAEPTSVETTDDIGSHTPTDLQHPCDLVSARTASKALGEKVTAHRVTSKLAARTLD